MNDSPNKIFYIGSTKASLYTRYTSHKFDFKRATKDNKITRKLHVAFKKYNIDKFQIKLITYVDFADDIKTLRRVEQNYIDTLSPPLNSINACVTSIS